MCHASLDRFICGQRHLKTKKIKKSDSGTSHTSITVPAINKIHLFVCICVVKDMLKRNEYMLETRISQATSTRKASYRHISTERVDYTTYLLHTNKTRLSTDMEESFDRFSGYRIN